MGGEQKHLYRAIGKAGGAIDFLLRARRNKVAARRKLIVVPQIKYLNNFVERDSRAPSTSDQTDGLTSPCHAGW